jgi:hypothetical protein
MRLILLGLVGLILAGCVIEPLHPEWRRDGYSRHY